MTLYKFLFMVYYNLCLLGFGLFFRGYEIFSILIIFDRQTLSVIVASSLPASGGFEIFFEK